MIDEQTVESALDFLRDNAGKIAKARAERVYLEQFRKSKKALLFDQSSEETVAAREQWALRHSDYLQVLDALRAAVEEDERLRFLSAAAEAKIEVWRTIQANVRAEQKAF
jgi:uncharacterized protein (DUF2132 family)